MQDKTNVDYRDELATKLLTIFTQNFNLEIQPVEAVLDRVLSDYEIDKESRALVQSDVMERLQMYIAVKKLDGLSKGTLENYYREIKRFSENVVKPINSVTTMDLRRYLSQYHDSVKPSTYNSKVSMIKAFFRWLHSEGYIDTNPSTKVRRVNAPKRTKKPIPSDKLEEMFSKCETDRERAVLSFLYSTGARVSEAVSVDVGDINWSDNSLFVVGKGNKERKIYFTARAKSDMLHYLDNRSGNDIALFTSHRKPFGRVSVDVIQGEVKRIGERVGLNISPHSLRHTSITNALNKGMSLAVVQDLAGHNDSNTTRIYGRVEDTFAKQEYRKF